MRTKWDLLDIGSRFICQNDLAAAESVFVHLTQTEPDLAEAWYSLAWILDQQGRYAEAARALAKAIELEPDCDDVWLDLRRSLGRRAAKAMH